MTEQSKKEFYSVDQASQHAAEWCKRNPAWRRICDIPDISVFEKTYDEILKRERAYGKRTAAKNAGVNSAPEEPRCLPDSYLEKASSSTTS
ncbi:hypothetical protein [Pseudomonas sp.]|uniref:hypothetical protein n=1 Tax=Pseudomonas sp. TaxID=306 RepID=UPI0028A839A9|nr:hypothetical protein [Pseudomonas sp.]